MEDLVAAESGEYRKSGFIKNSLRHSLVPLVTLKTPTSV